MPKELKLRLYDKQAVIEKLQQIGAKHLRGATYEYTYFNQPKGSILKLTKKGAAGIFKTIIKPDGQRFIIESSDKLAHPEQIRQELTAQYGVKKQLANHRSIYKYEDHKISINDIKTLGTFLIIEGENPQLAFATNVLGIQNPEVITESFDNVQPSHAPVYAIHLPEYQVDAPPDYRKLGKVVDDELKKHFTGQMVGLRALGSQEHPGKTADDLIEIIKRDGTDRYDSERNGDRYDNIENKHIDLFLLRRKISERSDIFWQLAWSFYESPLKLRGQPVRVDILVIYDLAKLRAVRTTYTHEGYPVTKRDGFVFREPNKKNEAVLGIIKILA